MPYMSPVTYLENNRWQDAAWGLVRGILERMAWKESHVREVDRPDLCAVHSLDVVRFAEYLHRLDDAQGHVLDAWIEIDGSDSEWCATLTR